MCTGRGSNQGPVGPKSDALTTAPLRHLIYNCQSIAVQEWSKSIEIFYWTTSSEKYETTHFRPDVFIVRMGHNGINRKKYRHMKDLSLLDLGCVGCLFHIPRHSPTQMFRF